AVACEVTGRSSVTFALPGRQFSWHTSQLISAPIVCADPDGSSFGGVTGTISITSFSYAKFVMSPGRSMRTGTGNCTSPAVNPAGKFSFTRVARPESPGFFQ